MTDRADRSTREEVDARTAEVAEMMVRGKWSRALCKQLAERWGIAPRTVRDYARIASRLVWTGDQGDLDEIRASTISKLEMLALKAENGGELRTAVSALAEMAKVAGAAAPQRIDVRAVVATLTPQQALEVPAVVTALGQLAAGLDEYQSRLDACTTLAEVRALPTAREVVVGALNGTPQLPPARDGS